MSRFTQPPIAQPAGGGNFSGAALAAHINELAAAILSGHYDAELPVGAGAGLLRSRPVGTKIRMSWFDGAAERDLFELDPATGTVVPLTITAAQVGALALSGGQITGSIVKDGSGDWGRFKSDLAGESYAKYHKQDGAALGYLGNETSLFSGGSADKFGMRSEDDLFLLAGGESVKAELRASGEFTVSNQPFFDARINATFTIPGTIWTKCPNVFNVITNTGSHFDPSITRFTAPVRGRYYFEFMAERINNFAHPQYLAFFVNGLYDVQSRVYHEQIERRGSEVTSRTIMLNAGDYISPYIYCANTSAGFDNSGKFTGILLN